MGREVPCKVCSFPVEIDDDAEMFARVANKMAAKKDLVPIGDDEVAIHPTCRPEWTASNKTDKPRALARQESAASQRLDYRAMVAEGTRTPGEDDDD